MKRHVDFTIKLKQALLSRRAIFSICLVIFAISLYFLLSLIKELTTKNYHYHGTHYDFMAFYTAGKAVLMHNSAHLYDATQVTALQRQIIPHPVGAAGYMPFLNPPFTAVFLAPLALFTINTARLLWLVISMMIGVFVLLKLTHQLSGARRIVAVILLLFCYPLFQTFIEGHIVILVLLGSTASYLYFAQHKKLASGAWLAPLWIIPQFGLFMLIGLLVKREWQMLKRWALSSALLLAITLPVTGIKIYFTYIKFLTETTQHHFIDLTTSAQLDWRGPLNMSSGLNGFYESIIGQGHTRLINILFALSAGALVVYIVRVSWILGKKWNASQEAMMFCAAVLVACVVNPHLYAQDAVVMFLIIPALFTLYKKIHFQAVVLFAAFCNLIYLDQYIRVHLFTLIAVFVTIFYIHESVKIKSSNSKVQAIAHRACAVA